MQDGCVMCWIKCFCLARRGQGKVQKIIIKTQTWLKISRSTVLTIEGLTFSLYLKCYCLQNLTENTENKQPKPKPLPLCSFACRPHVKFITLYNAWCDWPISCHTPITPLAFPVYQPIRSMNCTLLRFRSYFTRGFDKVLFYQRLLFYLSPDILFSRIFNSSRFVRWSKSLKINRSFADFLLTVLHLLEKELEILELYF